MSDAPVGGADSASPAAKERAAALIGRTISDRYKILELVAFGGMGAVYRAEHLLMRKQVAIKVLHPEIEGFPELVARFEREAVAGAHIDHPNVATASDFGKFDGESRFLVLEFIRGKTLRELMNRGPVSAMRALKIIRQVAAALTAVHQKNIVHRDIKPRNIMIIDETRRTRRLVKGNLGAEDVVKLIDFGLAKVPVEELSPLAQDADNPRRSLTNAGVVMGTVGYMAPEAALGMKAIQPRADLYSLGVIFYEMLSGKQPFEGPEPTVLFQQHRNKPVPAMSERNPTVQVPKGAEDIARKLLEKDPDDRYASADALVQAIDNFIKPPDMHGAPPLPAPSQRIPASGIVTGPRSDPRPGARRAFWVASVAGVLAVVVTVVVLASTSKSSTPAPASGEPAPSAAATTPTSAHPPTSSAPVDHSPTPKALSVGERLRAAADGQDPANAVAVFLDLAEREAGAFKERSVQAEAAAAIELAASAGQPGDAVFDRLANQLGTDGLDILYDLVVRELRSNDPMRVGVAPPNAAGPRARAILSKPDVIVRATPAMRVAYEMRKSSCSHRVNFFPRAAKDGDDRALELLTSMQPPACSRKDACCFEKHRELERAIAEIQSRLRAQ